ncbi:Uncharacterized oxidoreductase At4g09670, partial [Linum perenne]
IALKLARAITISPNSHLSDVAIRTLEKATAFAGANNLSSADELDQILDACEDNCFQFMDGTMWIHHPQAVGELRAATWVVSATPSAVISDAGVILAYGASLLWTDGKAAMFHCSFLTNFTSIVTAMGTKAALQVTGYVIPIAEEAATFTVAVKIGFDERD